MAKWEIEVIFEPTGDYMNFEYETDIIEEDDIYKEVANQLSIVPNLIDEDESNVIPFERIE
jgi:hypothetical protein